MNDLAEIISQNADSIRQQWVAQMSGSVQRPDLISRAEVEEQCRTILEAVVQGVRTSGVSNVAGPGWDTARELLKEISSSRARQGFSPTDVATFVLSLKQALFEAVRSAAGKSQEQLFETVWAATELVDRLALITTEAFIYTREELISRQQQELLELSTMDGKQPKPRRRRLQRSRSTLNPPRGRFCNRSTMRSARRGAQWPQSQRSGPGNNASFMQAWAILQQF